MPDPGARSEVERTDVVVVGGGASGVAAAIGAARAGAEVLLVERYGFLGGAATISSVLSYCGFFDQTGRQVVAGVGRAVLESLRGRGVYLEHRFAWSGNTIVLLDSESLKLILDQLVFEAGVKLRLHTRLIGARVDGNRIEAVETVDAGLRRMVQADAFVDASGDGFLSYSAGADVRTASAESRRTATLAMRIGGVPDDADLSQDGIREAVERYNATSSRCLVRDRGAAARLPVTREIIMQFADEFVDALDVDDLSHAEVSGRRQAWQYLDAFREHLRGWECAYLVATGPQIGIRESRHLVGVETVRGEDVESARKRDDAVALCGWPIEEHPRPGTTRYTPIAGKGHYDIPYDALRARNVDNLWVGGRLVSSDDRAYASLRVMGTAFATGHAAGIAAALYKRGAKHDFSVIRKELLRQGALLA